MPAYRHLYVHVPFCEVICHYCHFYTARSSEAPDQTEFFAALLRDLDRPEASLAPRLEAVYFGGGTPAASPPELLERLLRRLGERVGPETEVTLEANPRSLTRDKARRWKDAGINRISLGVQSLDDPTLKRLGRAHSVATALSALEACAGEIANVSCDLLYAVPGQPEDAPAGHALRLFEAGARHLSLYHLTLEPSHFLHSQLPSDSFAWNQLRHVADALAPRGFRHYEIASFGLPGTESRNNLNYWSGGPYYALGPAAHGYDGARTRWANVRDWREYMRRASAGESTRAWTEELSQEQLRMEYLLTRFRTDLGLDLEDFFSRFGERLENSRQALLRRWIDEGLVLLDEGKLMLTFSGRMLSDEIVRALL